MLGFRVDLIDLYTSPSILSSDSVPQGGARWSVMMWPQTALKNQSTSCSFIADHYLVPHLHLFVTSLSHLCFGVLMEELAANKFLLYFWYLQGSIYLSCPPSPPLHNSLKLFVLLCSCHTTLEKHLRQVIHDPLEVSAHFFRFSLGNLFLQPFFDLPRLGITIPALDPQSMLYLFLS